jgi:hypothetical protein
LRRQNLEGKGLIFKIFRNKDLALFFASIYQNPEFQWLPAHRCCFTFSYQRANRTISEDGRALALPNQAIIIASESVGRL